MMISARCEKVIWSGREAFRLYAAGYESVVVPSLGANVISLRATVNGQTVDILRTPPDGETLLNDPYAYGVPILFPANRVAGGKYSWDGVEYSFPKNYPNNVHIHGVLHNREWPVAGFGAENSRAWVRFTLDTDQDSGLFQHFPVSMAIHLEITLSENGLTHSFTVRNKSKDMTRAGGDAGCRAAAGSIGEPAARSPEDSGSAGVIVGA
jgi:aldose 1-epimerase